MEKGIQKYLIEFCSSNQFIGYLREQVQPNILINNDIDKFIRHTKAPTNINVNEEIQQLLVDNIDKLCL